MLRAFVALVELMQKDSSLPCFAALGEQTAQQLRDRCQQGLTQSAVEEHVDRLIDTSLGSNWTRLYDSVSLGRRAVLYVSVSHGCASINIIHSLYYDIIMRNNYTGHISASIDSWLVACDDFQPGVTASMSVVYSFTSVFSLSGSKAINTTR